MVNKGIVDYDDTISSESEIRKIERSVTMWKDRYMDVIYMIRHSVNAFDGVGKNLYSESQSCVERC